MVPFELWRVVKRAAWMEEARRPFGRRAPVLLGLVIIVGTAQEDRDPATVAKADGERRKPILAADCGA